MNKTTFLRSFVLAALFVFGAIASKAQFAFTNSNSLLSTTTHSGNSVTVVDVNNDGLDDILTMDQANTLILELQHQNGTYTMTNLGVVPGGGVWGMSVADVDHNGWKDVATGAGNCYLYKLSYSGGVVSATITTLAGSYFVQNITFGDFDNDGWVDLAVCDDDDYMKIYKNTTGTLNLQVPTSAIINTNINPGMTIGGDPYDSGNYGSVWTDFDNDGDLDLYIAHCRQSASSNTDPRRRDRLFVNNGAGSFTEAGQSHGFETTDFKQTWTTSFGDMDNDGDLDVVMVNHGENSQILKNDGTGHFTDASAGSGINVTFDPIESIVEDFDNDGWLDILISGPGLVMYHNNHDGTYSQAAGAFGGAMASFLSFATGDLNHDGAIDLFASYGNVYNSPTTTDDVLWMNTKTSNHFITFNLTGTTSNPNAIGARVTIHGAFGTQVREVRAGESYGTCNSFQLHFGLGSETGITSGTITWPSGLVTTLGALSADQFVTAVEGGCMITGNIIPGPHAFCTGSTLTLNASTGYTSYLWSNGATTSSITTGVTGNFNVMVTNAAGCTNISPTIPVLMDPNETPVVTVSGNLSACMGTITLTSTSALAYSWTGPGGFTASTQSISPTTSGSYSLTTTGTCQNWTATPVPVTILAAPMPTTTGASGLGPATFNLSASGSGGVLNWYTAPTGGASIATGPTYTTPTISTTTTYYVDESTSYPGPISATGQPYHTGASAYSGTTTNAAELFDVSAACILNTVKVYTNTAGTREIQLKNSGGTVINSLIVNIPIDTSVVTLNFSIPVGSGYQLTTNGALNTTNFGAVSPVLERSNAGVSYPYSVSGLISINAASTGTAFYYYFYDWKVQAAPTVCTSTRVPVTATVTNSSGISALNINNGVQVYPNPASDQVNISFDAAINTTAVFQLTDITGRVVRTLSVEKPAQGQTVQMNVSDLSAGTYMLTMKTDTRNLVQKLMLTK